jgi:hypothetical protein
MAKSIKFTGDKNSGLGKFAIYESVGEVDEAKEVFDESTTITEKFDITVDISAAAVDYLIDLAASNVTVKKALIKCGAPSLVVRINSPTAPQMVLSGVSIIGGQVNQLYVSNPGTAAVPIRVLAGG